MIAAVTVAFLLGGLAFAPAWVLYGAFVADSLHTRRHRRRRAQIDLDGADAVETWLTDIEFQRQHPANGTPFEGEGERA